MATKKKMTIENEIVIVQPEEGATQVHILGRTPLLLNRMSEKAMRELLMPRGRKNAMERASTLKHDPIAEFRSSAYLDSNPKGPTLIQHLATAFKGALKGAALDLPGAAKSQIGRLTYVAGERIPVYGTPKLHMAIVRSAGMNRTPDVRTRLCVPKWACIIEVRFVKPNLREETILTLLDAAGRTQGVGDWRPEKGSSNYGQFEVVNADNPEFRAIIKNGARAAQQKTFDDPEPYDDETAELLTWFKGEAKKRSA